ncbi:toxin-antitoxin system YwqK family antitoxin [Archangium lipolyticum]|uniref:toxin-antitoxin system YwqK family antitoxin n=1 Tax=Archangium lipolyticum TaxID=2970465 RepID=UPI00214A82DD|nr:hypothetical protein [Archangium lipolyticum]
MFKKASSRVLVLSLSLCASLTWAADVSGEVKLSCPAGTKQFGGRSTMTDRGVFCVKNVTDTGMPIAHGPYMSFHANGQKKAVGQHVDGAQSGMWTFYDENGVKTEEIEFSGANYHGKRVQYFSNGKPRVVEQYVKGKRNGLVQEFSEDGKLRSQTQYNDGHQVVAK